MSVSSMQYAFETHETDQNAPWREMRKRSRWDSVRDNGVGESGPDVTDSLGSLNLSKLSLHC